MLESVYARGRAEVGSALATLLDHQSPALQDTDVVQAALSVFKKSRSVGFSDRLVVENARRVGHLPLGTFDEALGALDGQNASEGVAARRCSAASPLPLRCSGYLARRSARGGDRVVALCQSPRAPRLRDAVP